MFTYFFKITRRSLVKNKLFSGVNILGLSVGLVVVLLICLMIFNEYSFDTSFKESGNIYRINSYLTKWQPGKTYCTTANALGPAMKEAIPEVRATVRMQPRTFVIRVDDQLFKEENFLWADEDFFRLFDVPFLYGSVEEALTRPNTAAISEKTARKLFGEGNPVGKTFLLENRLLTEVVAVFKDFPENSSFASFQIVGPFQYSQPAFLHRDLHWGNVSYETFCLLTEGADVARVEAQMKAITAEKSDNEAIFEPSLQRLDRIHLYSGDFLQTYLHAPSSIEKVKLLVMLAVVILVIACINYMNLSTARAQKRFGEVGISKTLGARRSNLIMRFVFETVAITLSAFLLAVILAVPLLPVFNRLLSETLSLEALLHPGFILSALSVFAVTAILSASYPAVYMSSFPPLSAIKAAFRPGSKHALVRKVLIVAQFVAAIVLISRVTVVREQIQFVNDKDLGYNPRDILGIVLPALAKESEINALKNEYRSQSSVKEIALSYSFPLRSGDGNSVYRNSEDQQGFPFYSNPADPELVKLLEMKLIAGECFSEKAKGDSITKIVINRKTAEYLEMTPEEIVGREIKAVLGGNHPHVVVSGVVEDFHFQDLHRPIVGYGIHNAERSKSFMMLRVGEKDMSQQLAAYEGIFKKYFPNGLFEVRFPDAELTKAYESERRTNRVSLVFSGLAILIACMGVFGLTAFMAEQRTKEIGIRKVLGARVPSIISMFANDYLKLLTVALVIAGPVAWWVATGYLRDFAYHVSLSWKFIAVGVLITATLTLITVVFQAVKAARANPVKSIK